MIYKKRGRWEMVINAEIGDAESRRRKRIVADDDLRRGEIRRKIEAREEQQAIEEGDLW